MEIGHPTRKEVEDTSISWEAKWSSVQSEQDCPHVFIEAQRSRRGLSLKCGRGVWIPQEKDAANISQNRPRPPRNPEEKVFFSVTVKGIPTDLTEVGLMDSSGGLDHSSMAKPEKKDLHKRKTSWSSIMPLALYLMNSSGLLSASFIYQRP